MDSSAKLGTLARVVEHLLESTARESRPATRPQRNNRNKRVLTPYLRVKLIRELQLFQRLQNVPANCCGEAPLHMRLCQQAFLSRRMCQAGQCALNMGKSLALLAHPVKGKSDIQATLSLFGRLSHLLPERAGRDPRLNGFIGPPAIKIGID